MSIDTETLTRLLKDSLGGEVTMTPRQRGEIVLPVRGTRADIAALELLSLGAPLAQEVLRLRALLEGSTTPPTSAEDEAARSADLFPHKVGRRWHFFDREGRVAEGPVIKPVPPPRS